MGWIQTFTGKKFYPLDPSDVEVDIEDIAHALALKCRYGGHCIDFFSVAQHSVMVSNMVTADCALWGLLHDAAEAYLPDVARPIKHALGMHVVEDRVLNAIANHFNLQLPWPPSITSADLCCLERERRQLMTQQPDTWATEKWWDEDTTPITCWDWKFAKLQFLNRFHELTNHK